ncbi:uncharacterized protein TRIADDRAFT_34957 [Trichoplax adhaerens]|uniref:C2H2-type domain-containing protein n=1 Tax=Trichoplax adhaerens TaxID=10228 RepID=B3SFA3_TRIAD|nr:hypothetical protein TRIADDRAFT_34957 [Trichoplax adhaerens]EDV18592.1 hypothetical protein TRIADDRAFT_34957 [Trichoplax adhaerens]|eukprot:XP_002118922.1 hypothetical protein TRIADDRAFT_34957 [Trichoplax adhaerens]
MGRVRRKRVHKNIKDIKKKARTRHKTKDIDQIHQDLRNENARKLLQQSPDMDLPGLAQFYCLECARYFIDQKALTDHKKQKVHRNRYLICYPLRRM